MGMDIFWNYTLLAMVCSIHVKVPLKTGDQCGYLYPPPGIQLGPVHMEAGDPREVRYLTYPWQPPCSACFDCPGWAD